MPTNLTDRLGELVDKVTPGPCLVNPASAWVEIPDADAPICAMLWPTELRSEGETFANAEYIALCFTHKDEILSALRKVEAPVMGDYAELVGRLRTLQVAATPGPYRAHDHNDMARLGEDPDKWVGYAWVGRVTKDSEPDGRFDAGWLDCDRRKDGCKEYRERASADVHFVTETLNALPELLAGIDEIERLTAEGTPHCSYSDCARARLSLGDEK